MTADANPQPRAVLVIGFNRPKHLARVLSAVVEAAAPRIYVALDGPRAGNAGDVVACSETRATAEQWAAQTGLTLLAREENLGCRRGVASAVDWFFDREDDGIILEDDCLPSPQFFGFCAHLLERFRSDRRVWMVSGANLLGEFRREYGDYFFSDGGVWGWATWRDRWAYADFTSAAWRDDAARRRAQEFLGESEWCRAEPAIASAFAEEIDTWDYQWLFARASNHGLAVVPTGNLVTNVGFGPGATHTTTDAPVAHLAWRRINLPPDSTAPFAVDARYMRLKAKKHRPSLRTRLIRRAARLFGSRDG